MANNVLIRSALLCEQKQLEALQLRASLSNAGDRNALLANPNAIELPNEQIADGHVFVVEIDGSIVGFAAILPRTDGDSELDALFVEPEKWRQGIARMLITHCKDVARNQGSKAIHVIGNPHAKAFYSAVGFNLVGTMQTRFGVGLLFCMSLENMPLYV
jgi:N-acetylglutamate synthase-like GNAT family acetyltransferase